MWSFVTHAGAGMAIAGLTATYYALSRANYQGERERMSHEQGFGDGPQVNRLRKHNENSHLTSSHMLLKKELEELSTLQGSGSGLNVIYQQKNPTHRLYRSNFEIFPIISRVDTRPSSTYLPSEEEEVGSGPQAAPTSGASGDSVFGIESNADNDKSNLMSGGDGGSSDRKNKDTFVTTEELPNLLAAADDSETKAKSVMMMVSIIDEKAGEDNNTTTEDIRTEIYAKDVNSTLQNEMMDDNENDWEDVPSSTTSNVTQTESVGIEHGKPVQENQVLKRTPSPICFFKNPGFGSRFAVNVKKKKPSPLVAKLSASKINAEAEAAEVEQQGHSKTQAPREETDVQLSPSVADTCQQNSTQFILSPELSKSNVSLCEAENPEKLLKRRKKLVPNGSPAAADATENSTVVNTNPIKEMSEYNKKIENKVNNGRGDEVGTEPRIRLRADPENANFHPPLKRVVRPVMRIPPSEPDNKGQQCKDENKNKTNNDENSPAEKTGQKEIDHEEDEHAKVNTYNVTLQDKDKEEDEKVLEKTMLPPPLVSQNLPESSVQKVELNSTRTTGVIGDIPNDSWIALPVRVFTTSIRTLPWPLIGFCILVVIIAGVLGMFLTKLADSISQSH